MKKILTAVAMLSIVLMIVLQPIALAWMSDNGMSSPIDITTNVHKSYFESGNGTATSPYEIKYPVQFYYFAWLQYLGFFNQDSDKDGDIDTTFYFRVSADIDMKDLQAESENGKLALPPIGTTDNPFIGNFDGEGHTIKNLTVENKYSSLIDPPDGTDDFGGAEIIGCFGVVGELIVENPTVKYDYSSLATEVKNVILENLTVKTQTNQALIGLVAGYVNGTVDRVGVVSSTVDIKAGTTPLGYTSNISDYSLIGYCTEDYRDSVYTLNLSLKAPGLSNGSYNVVPDMTGDGNQQGWGGSVKMLDIYTWLTDVSEDRASTNGSYVLERTDLVNLNGVTVTLDYDTASKLNYTVSGFGSFVITNSQPNFVNFVSGAVRVTQFKYAYTDNDVAVYYITDGTYYLNFNGNNISSTTDQANATKWYVSNGANGGNVYTVVNGDIYYLTINNNAISTIHHGDADRNNLPSWAVSGDTYSCNGIEIECVDGTWQVVTSSAGVGSFKLSLVYDNVRYYFTNNGTNATQRTTDANAAAVWTIEAVNGGYTISTVINGVTYYLSHNGLTNGGQTAPTLSRTPLTWQYSDNRIYLVNGGSNYYLRYSRSGGGFVIQPHNETHELTFTQVSGAGSGDTDAIVDLISAGTQKSIEYVQSTYIDNSPENYRYDNNGNKVVTGAGITYFPLSTTVNVGQNSYQIDATNTGYIIGAEWGAIERSEHDQYGNIRIAAYDAGSMNNYATPWTMTYKTGGKFKTISEIPTKKENLTTAQKEMLSKLGLSKYADCYGDYRSSITNKCYGLHFMQASVSITNTTRVNVHLNGKDIPNYEMPTNCIDFNLYDRGFINFVAGSYFTAQGTNNSFFSIYQITRDPNDETSITAIKEICKIYAAKTTSGDIDTSKAYHYTYLVNGAEVGTDTIPAGYEMVFDCHWITHPNESNYYESNNTNGDPTAWSNNRAFYFEVPVNAGEYAIGSTEGRTGAYLTYLDLAANAQLIEREKSYEEITENSASATIPNGVDLLDPKAENFGLTLVNPSDSAFATINGTTSGSIKYDKEGNVVKHTATSGTTAEYVGVGGKLVDGKGNVMTVPWTSETVIKRTTYRDNNINTGVFTVTVIDEIHVTEDGKETVKYKKHVTTTYPTGHEDYPNGAVVEKDFPEQSEPLHPDTKDEVALKVGNDKLIDIAFSYGSDVNLTVSYEYVPAEKNENGNVTAAPKYIITITNGGTEAVKIKAIITEAGTKSGITFVITDGTTETTLNANTDEQIVEIAPSANNGETGGETGGDTGETT